MNRAPLRIDSCCWHGVLPVFLIITPAVIVANQPAGIVVFEDTVADIHSGTLQIDGDSVTGGITVANGKSIQPAVRALIVLKRQEWACFLQIDNGCSSSGGTAQLNIITFKVQLPITGSRICTGGNHYNTFINGMTSSKNSGSNCLFGFSRAFSVITVIAVCPINIYRLCKTAWIITESKFIWIGNAVAIAICRWNIASKQVLI